MYYSSLLAHLSREKELICELPLRTGRIVTRDLVKSRVKLGVMLLHFLGTSRLVPFAYRS